MMRSTVTWLGIRFRRVWFGSRACEWANPHQPNGFLIFDDMVLDKAESQKIELVRQQWSGNAKQVIRGIGVVTCVYVNPETDQFWIIDYRIFAPETDQKTKLDHMREMLANAVHQKRLPFRVVLMDTWYAAKNELLFIEELGKVYYCPVRENRLVSLDRKEKGYHRVDSLLWSQDELRTGRLVHMSRFSCRSSGEIVPPDALYRAHGLYRDERFGSGLDACHTRSVGLATQD